MADKSPTSEKFKVYGRASFLRLDRPKAFDDGGDPRWEATCLLDPADKQGLESIKLVIKQAAAVSKDAYGIVPYALKELASDFIPGAPKPEGKKDGIEIALYNGDTKDYDGYAGMLVVPAHNAKLKPAVANRKGVSVDPGDDQFPYSGCFIWMSLAIWAQVGKTQQKYGKRIGTNLRGVQFAKDGEPFGAGDIAPEEEFEALEDDAGAAGDDDIGF